MNILTVGDSHAFYPWHRVSVEGVKIDVGGHKANAMMYHFGKEKWVVKKLTENIDVAIFCFGEIDCRMGYITKYKDSHKELIENYMEAIALAIKPFPNLTACVECVTPPLQDGNKEDVLLVNKSLKDACKKHGYIFIDVYDYYCDENGFMDMSKSDSYTTHFGDTKPLEDFIESLIGS